MEKLKLKYERKEEGIKKEIFTTENVDSVISWTLTALYDGAIKRAKVKTNQYYIDNKEYCEIIATYTRYNPDGEEVKDIYTIKNWSNDWGNYINVYDTLKNNNIEIKKEVK